MSMLDVLKPGLALKPFSEKQPEHVWVGALKGAQGACRKAKIDLRAQISITGGVLIGRGASANFPHDAPGAAVALEGGASAGGVHFDLVIETGDLARAPFLCAGVMNAAETEMTGGFEIRCIYPGICDCAGGGGSFRLTKVED
ncbi:MAG: hypothetical protein ACOYJ6_01190 [Caulobacterales bacterium]